MGVPLAPSLIAELTQIVGAGDLAQGDEARQKYGRDSTPHAVLPELVLFPESRAEVSAICRLASRERIPIVPRGGGTGWAGGAVAVPGGLTLSFEKMNRLLELNAPAQRAVAQPGLITAELDRAARRHGLFYPPDPSSLAECTLGGNVATGAGGARTMKYGETRDYVMGLEVVLASGEVLRLGGRTRKQAVGYDLTALMVGSEGTLGIITEITARLIPAPPFRQTLLAGFPGEEEAFARILELLALPQLLTACEYLDQHSLACLRPELTPFFNPLPQAMLLLEIDAESSPTLTARLEQVQCHLYRSPQVQVVLAHNAAEADRLWAVRRALSPALLQLKPDKINEDICVPLPLMPKAMAFARQLCREARLVNANFGHAGDGNIHVNIMYDRRDLAETARAHTAVATLLKEVVRLGGTISGEHGVGLAKKPYVHFEAPLELRQLWGRVKRAFDPLGILNPKKICDEL